MRPSWPPPPLPLFLPLAGQQNARPGSRIKAAPTELLPHTMDSLIDTKVYAVMDIAYLECAYACPDRDVLTQPVGEMSSARPSESRREATARGGCGSPRADTRPSWLATDMQAQPGSRTLTAGSGGMPSATEDVPVRQTDSLDQEESLLKTPQDVPFKGPLCSSLKAATS